MQRTRTSAFDVAYIWFRYLRKHGRVPRLFRPVRYTEKIQWRKLFDFDPLYTLVTDKLGMRDFVAERVGAEFLVPLLWAGDSPDTVPFGSFTEPYVLKCTHGNSMNLFMHDPYKIDAAAARAKLHMWLLRNHGKALVEPAYISIIPRLIAERMLIDADGRLPVEYKYLMFGGRTALIGVRKNIDHQTHTTLQMRPEWTPVPLRFDVPISVDSILPLRPEALDRMTILAETLGAEFDHIRVDFLLADSRIYVGELTLYPHSGMVPLEPDEFDLWMGELWELESPVRRAIHALAGRSAAMRDSSGK